MMRRTLLFVFLCFLSLGMFSCQKRFMEVEPVAVYGVVEDPVLLETAHQYYTTELSEKMLSGMIRAYQNCVECKGKTTKNNTKKTSPPEIKVVWEKAHTTEYGQKRYVEVPVRASQRVVNLIDIKRDSLSYTPDSTMFKTIFDRLLISRNRGDDKFSSQIIRFHPDRDYLEKYNYDINHLHLHGLNDFTGYLEYFTSEWERISAVRVVDGKPKRRYRLKKSS